MSVGEKLESSMKKLNAELEWSPFYFPISFFKIWYCVTEFKKHS